MVVKPNHEHTTIFDENLVAVHMKKTEVVFSKPVYLGMSILDISKTLMYDFHYNFMQKKYAENCRLLMTNTDSLMHEIKTEDFCRDIKDDISEKFETSNFQESHASGVPRLIKKVPGMFEDKCGGKIISDFVGLRAQLYSYKMYNENGEGKEV